jgi:hypothetical protein
MSRRYNQKKESVVLLPEEVIGLEVAGILRCQFGAGHRLLERCEELAAVPSDNPVAPIVAAARMIRASGQLAFGLARIARIETRHRSIIEPVQPFAAAPAELNSEKNEPPGSAMKEFARRIENLSRMNDYDAQIDFVASAAGIEEYDARQIVPAPRLDGPEEEEEDG